MKAEGGWCVVDREVAEYPPTRYEAQWCGWRADYVSRLMLKLHPPHFLSPSSISKEQNSAYPAGLNNPAIMGSDPQYASYPNLLLSQHIFTLKTPSLSSSHAAAHKALTSSIKEHSQAPLYRYLAHPTEGILSGNIEWDENYYEELKKSNDDKLEGYDKELEEAEEKAGESEVVEAMGKKAEFWARVVDKVGSSQFVAWSRVWTSM